MECGHGCVRGKVVECECVSDEVDVYLPACAERGGGGVAGVLVGG